MTYATQQGMIDSFGAVELAQRTDRTNGTVIDVAVLGKALGDADSAIDGFLAKRYRLPLQTVPASLERLAADIARYYLYGDGATEAVRTRYQDAIKLLGLISKGDVLLDATGVVPPAADTSVAVLSRSPKRQFDAAGLAMYSRASA